MSKIVTLSREARGIVQDLQSDIEELTLVLRFHSSEKYKAVLANADDTVFREITAHLTYNIQRCVDDDQELVEALQIGHHPSELRQRPFPLRAAERVDLCCSRPVRSYRERALQLQVQAADLLERAAELKIMYNTSVQLSVLQWHLLMYALQELLEKRD